MSPNQDFNIAGRWVGYYAHDDEMRPQVEIEIGFEDMDDGIISGTMLRPFAAFKPTDILPPGPSIVHGNRILEKVSFTVGGLNIAQHQVKCAGVLTADGNKLSGRWNVLADRSAGTFELARHPSTPLRERSRTRWVAMN